MKSYKNGVTAAIGIGPVWQARFHIRIATQPWRALEYIHLNPVRAHITDDPALYPWSSASGKWDVSPLDIC